MIIVRRYCIFFFLRYIWLCSFCIRLFLSHCFLQKSI